MKTMMLALGCAATAGCTRDAETKVRDDDPAAVHRDSLVIDTHIDVPYRIAKHGTDISVRQSDGHFDFVRAREGGLDAAFFAVYIPSKFNKPGTSPKAKGGAWDESQRVIELVKQVVAKSGGAAELARSPEEVERIVASGKHAVLLGLENGSPIEGDLGKLRQLFDQGIRYITLTHSKDNQIADSSYDKRHTHSGLSKFGRQVVREMNRLGMIIDVSHLSDEAFWDVLELSEAPLVATHSGLRTYRNWERNISDDMLRKLAAKGGVFHMNFGSAFLRDDVALAVDARDDALRAVKKAGGTKVEIDERTAAIEGAFEAKNATIDDVVEQILHAVTLVGADHVGLGSDFDGVNDVPRGLDDVSAYPRLTEALLKKGLSADQVRSINGGAFMHAWRKIIAEGRRSSAKSAP